MCSISKLTFTRFNFFKFPLILQNASAIRNQHYMKTRVKKWRKQDNIRSLSQSLTKTISVSRDLGNWQGRMKTIQSSLLSFDRSKSYFGSETILIFMMLVLFMLKTFLPDLHLVPIIIIVSFTIQTAPEINDSKLQPTFFIHCVPT